MSSIQYTPAQRTAVFYPDGNLLLSAAAGSGKTAALTGRIVELIRQGRASLSDMLIVTFTRAAAAEMRSRISSKLLALAEESRGSDPALAARISRALAEVPSADISTIHAFLYKALRPYFPLSGLPSDARIAETRAVDAMKREAMRETVDDFFRRSPEGDDSCASFPELADGIGQARDADALDEELLWLADKLLLSGLDENALSVYAGELDGIAGIRDSAFGKIIHRELLSFCGHYTKVFSALREEFETEPEVRKAYGPTLDGILEWLGGLDGAVRSPETTYEMLGTVLRSLPSHIPARLGSLAKDNATESALLFKSFRDEMKKTLDSRLLEPFFAGSEEEAKAAAHATARLLRCAGLVIGEFFRKFREAKAARAVLDYNDLEWFALRLLIDENGRPTRAAAEIGKRCRYVFIDEYQDTNGVQDRIFRAVCGRSVRFLVGDIKQSIYRFRGADPSVFTEYRRSWENLPPVGEGEALSEEWDAAGGRSLFMSENFRCAKPIVDFTNCVSEYILPHSGTPFSDGDRLIHARNEEFEAPPVQLCLIETKADPAAESTESTESAESTEEEKPENPEAVYVARRIASMLGRYAPDGKILRASDIAILLRSPGSSGGDYQKALAEVGIASRMKTEQPLSAYPSVMLLMCLLNFIDNPLRDIYAAGALRSPVFGFELSDLVRLKESSGSLTLWESLTAFIRREGREEPAAASEPLREKCIAAEERLRRWKTVMSSMAADRALEFLLRDADLFAIPGIRGNGAERDAVQRFTRLCRTYEQNSRGSGMFGGLSGFLDFAADELEGTDSAENDGSSSEDCVPILSIHASKGLEFPVCFLSECAKGRNTADETRTILFDSVMGLGMSLPDEGGLTKCDTLVKKVISEKLRTDSVDEEMRMLYVALTRAQTRLIVTARVADAEKAQTDAAAQAEFSDLWHVSHTKNYLGWMLEALKKHPLPDSVEVVTIPLSAKASAEERAEEAEAVSESEKSKESEETAKELTRDEWLARFAYRYPNAYRSRLPAKLTVSRLYPQILDEEDDLPELAAESAAASSENEKKPPARPDFMLDSEEIRLREGSPTERGSAAHIFLQFTDYRRLRENGVQAELNRLLEARYLTPAQGKLIPPEQIEKFRRSKLMDSLLRSDFVRREFRFNVRMPAEDFTADPELAESLRQNGEKITVQGVVDCVYRDPDTGKLILIDYKTDTFTAAEWRDRKKAEAKLRERHTRQLTYYREICGRLFGETIEKAMVYATAMGVTVEI